MSRSRGSVDRGRPVVVVYTRERCGLCRTAEAVVAREAVDADIRHVDIDTDDELQRRYGIRVPVVVVDGVEVAEVEVPKGAVRRAVRQASKESRTRSARRLGAFRRGGPAA